VAAQAKHQAGNGQRDHGAKHARKRHGEQRVHAGQNGRGKQHIAAEPHIGLLAD